MNLKRHNLFLQRKSINYCGMEVGKLRGYAISTFFKLLQRAAEQLTPTPILKQIIETAFRKFFNVGNKSPPKMKLATI